MKESYRGSYNPIPKPTYASTIRYQSSLNRLRIYSYRIRKLLINVYLLWRLCYRNWLLQLIIHYKIQLNSHVNPQQTSISSNIRKKRKINRNNSTYQVKIHNNNPDPQQNPSQNPLPIQRQRVKVRINRRKSYPNSNKTNNKNTTSNRKLKLRQTPKLPKLQPNPSLKLKRKLKQRNINNRIYNTNNMPYTKTNIQRKNNYTNNRTHINNKQKNNHPKITNDNKITKDTDNLSIYERNYLQQNLYFIQKTRQIQTNTKMDQQQLQYDIYYQGTKQQLYTMLYPLTGPSSPIFDHLDITKIQFNNSNKKFQFTYKIKDFTNIDKQEEPVVYRSMCLPMHSNYFYSTFMPESNSFVWRSVNRMMQLRPTSTKAQQQPKQKQKQVKNQPKGQQISPEPQQQDQVRQLTLIVSEDAQNKPVKQIYNVPTTQKLNRNWDISKEQYIARLCQ